MGTSRRTLFAKLNPTLFRSLESAASFARLRGNPYVELAHWLHQLWQANDSDLHRIVRHYQMEPAEVDRGLSAALTALPGGASSLSDFSHHIGPAVEQAWVVASLEFNGSCIRSGLLLSALLRSPQLRGQLTVILPAVSKVSAEHFFEVLPAVIAGSPEDREGPHGGTIPASPAPEGHGTLVAAEGDGSALAKYCSDLTSRARAGEIDPVIGRELEIRSVVDILLRRRQNNPLLTGEAGVGKTAVVEGLALAIVRGEVPPALRDIRLLSLDVGGLLAGAGVRGEFESRLKGLLEEVERSPQPVVLFIDEAHTLIGAGGQAGTGDAANLLKPALARGRVRTVAATTWSEYKRHIEKDPALTRRFQVLQILEPAEQSAVDMLRGLVSAFAQHHGVTVLDEAVRASVTLSSRYLPSRQLPDKAISLLDTACARVAMSLHSPPSAVEQLRQRIAAMQAEIDLLRHEESIRQACDDRARHLATVREQLVLRKQELEGLEVRWKVELALVQRIHSARLERTEAARAPGGSPDSIPSELGLLERQLSQHQQETPLIHLQVDESVVASVISDWTGIPVRRMVRDEVAAVTQLQDTLDARVKGQKHALRLIAERIQTARARLTDSCKPVGVFLLVGPSGVGKTETALALAEAMYGGEQNLITINMSEFQESHTVSTLKGAPPGYVGFGEGGVLTEAVRRRPYSVILLDEVEKAHPDVHEIFYQVFDKGWMEDGEGRHIDFRNCTILLTSNVGADLIASRFENPSRVPGIEDMREALQPELRRSFPAAFIGRLSVIPYMPLQSDALGSIVVLHLARVVDRLKDQHGIALRYGSSLARHMVDRCGTHETGVRRLIGFIEQKLLPELARHWLDALQQGRRIKGMFVDMPPSADNHQQIEGGDVIACQIEYA